ncbi:MAG: AraC family transcriptional regulator [Neisseria sp.]|uniref:AraC family transcriptional regulator n=1 Tax=Neisseria sp. TaxID=192066 RepID=UPI0026DC276C|nr:AraC family transcriptional regulator [Neisseria sp.]MDO4641055.1 AraC family transcriptional regulator [Neisseria sp.]
MTKISILDITILKRIIRKEDSTEIIPHKHPYGQFVLVTNGMLLGYTNHNQWLIKQNMGVWIPPNTTHWGIANEDAELVVLYLPPELCNNFGESLKLIESSLLLIAICDRLTRDNYSISNKNKHNLLQLLFEEIICSPAHQFILPLPQDSRLKKITDSIIKKPNERYTLTEWGQKVGATSRTLARLFKKETGLRYTEWHNRLLLIIACQELSKGTSNEQISAILGFSSGDSFGHWFRRNYNNSPGQARKAFKEKYT